MAKHPPEKLDMDNGIVVYKRLLKYGIPYWKTFMIAVVAMIVYSGLEPATAALMQPIIDGSFIDKDPAVMRNAPWLLLILFFFKGLANFFGDYYSGWVGRKITNDLRQAIFDKLVDLPCSYYDRSSSGQLLSKLLYNSEQVSAALTKGVITMIRDSVAIIGLLGFMVYQNALLSVVFLIVTPLLALCTRYVTKRFRKLSRRIQDSMGNVGHVAQETIDAQRIVKVFAGKDYERQRFATENQRNFKQQIKMVATDAISVPIVQFINICAFAALIFLVTQDSFRDTITIGKFVSFVAAMAMLSSPIKRITQINVTMQRGIAAGQSIFELLDSPSEQDTGILELQDVRGDIGYEDVSVVYDGRPQAALQNVSLHVPAGQTIALVGHSGSGKTTLARLLPRLYEKSTGRITIDGHDIHDFKLDNLRRHIAYVGQEVTLFNDTVAANIAYGCREAVSIKSIRAAAKAAYALDFIERLPQGFDTQIGQQGIALSGGQRQRIAIARALLKNAPILILDEATSALDAESERYVQQALEVLMRNRTTLVIAHRLSTIQNADCIYVMRNGHIIEQGTHTDLLANKTHYAELYNLQFQHGHLVEAEPDVLEGVV